MTTTSWQNRLLSPVLKRMVRPIAFPKKLAPWKLDLGYVISRKLELLAPSPGSLHIEAIQLPHCPAEILSTEATSNRAVLHLHGGGYNISSPRTYRHFNAHLASAANARILSVDYRQGTRSVWPTALDDAISGYEYLLSAGYESHQIVVVGDSAGGHLTLCTVLAIRDRALPPPAGAIAISPWSNLACDFPAAEENRHADVLLDIDAIRQLGVFYARGRDLKDPSISPAFASYEAIPPLYLIASTSEILRDDARAVRDAALKAGVVVRHEEYPDLPHAFVGMTMFIPEARDAVQNMADFISHVTG